MAERIADPSLDLAVTVVLDRDDNLTAGSDHAFADRDSVTDDELNQHWTAPEVPSIDQAVVVIAFGHRHLVPIDRQHAMSHRPRLLGIAERLHRTQSTLVVSDRSVNTGHDQARLQARSHTESMSAPSSAVLNKWARPIGPELAGHLRVDGGALLTADPDDVRDHSFDAGLHTVLDGLCAQLADPATEEPRNKRHLRG